MQRMSRSDAELFYDGRIPPDLVDPTLPSYFSAPANPVRLGRVTEKPASILRRMAQVMAIYAARDSLTKDDLLRHGFTEADIRAYAQDALRMMLVAHPTLTTVEIAA